MNKRVYIEMKTVDEGIRAVREVRKKISAEFDNDPQRLVEHYLAEQEKHQDRLLRPGTARRRKSRTQPAKRYLSGELRGVSSSLPQSPGSG